MLKKEDIIREAKTDPFETDQLIKDCLNEGIIFEPSLNLRYNTRVSIS